MAHNSGDIILLEVFIVAYCTQIQILFKKIRHAEYSIYFAVRSTLVFYSDIATLKQQHLNSSKKHKFKSLKCLLQLGKNRKYE